MASRCVADDVTECFCEDCVRAELAWERELGWDEASVPADSEEAEEDHVPDHVFWQAFVCKRGGIAVRDLRHDRRREVNRG